MNMKKNSKLLARNNMYKKEERNNHANLYGKTWTNYS